MEKIKKILVIIDTNRLGNYRKGSLYCKNYKYFDTNKHLHQSLVDNFSFKSQGNITIQVAIPEIVLEELKQQQNEAFISDLKKLQEQFNRFSKLEGAELNIPELNYTSHLESKKEGYLSIYGIKKIEKPTNEVLPKLLEKVLNKRKPFYKKNSQDDSGFKDALIWESIIKFVSENKYDRYFFLTNDSDFEDDLLKKEFFKTTGKEIKIVKEIADLKGMLEEEIKGTNLINQSLEKINNVLASEFRNIIYSNYVEIISGGNIHDVEEVVDFQILNIDVLKEDFILSVLFYFEHESLYSLYAKHGAFDESFIHPKEVSPVEIELIISKDYKIKKISSSDILINKNSEIDFE